MMKNLTLGKYLNLSRCASPVGAFSILALDHRNNLRKTLNLDDPASVPDSVLTKLKLDIISTIATHASALLLDPEVSAFPVVTANALPHSVGLIAALESTGYTGIPTSRESHILDGWSIEKAKMLGVNAVKLLVYYHPQSPTAPEIEELVAFTNEECARFDMPFILEILTYPIDKDAKKLLGAERKDAVVESARKLSQIGGDLLKMEFPLDIQANPDQIIWADACRELTAAANAPWVLLSASVNFNTYLDQVTIACRSGACGVAAGRAVWKEAIKLNGKERIKFLRGKAANRMRRLNALVVALAPPYTSLYQSKNTTYKDYYNVK